jgi:hypothetical protein
MIEKGIHEWGLMNEDGTHNKMLWGIHEWGLINKDGIHNKKLWMKRDFTNEV